MIFLHSALGDAEEVQHADSVTLYSDGCSEPNQWIRKVTHLDGIDLEAYLRAVLNRSPMTR
jgi:hypothetical protein